jgi:hypothetical protein
MGLNLLLWRLPMVFYGSGGKKSVGQTSVPALFFVGFEVRRAFRSKELPIEIGNCQEDRQFYLHLSGQINRQKNEIVLWFRGVLKFVQNA